LTVTGKPCKRPARLVPRRVKPRLRAHAFRVEVGKCIQLRIQPLDLPDVGLGELDHRKLPGAHELNC
jgi:hypothetical protein